MRTFHRLLCVCLALAWGIGPAGAQQVVFQENFDQLPLGPPVQEDSQIVNAFTHAPPSGWVRDATGVPGVENPSIGIFEWEGWSFANKEFWIDIANDDPGDGRRQEFLRGDGTILVADTNEWNDLGNPANNVGYYDTFLDTPEFVIGDLLNKGDRLQLQFDSSWIPQCCDDGANLDPPFGTDIPFENNKTARIRAKFEDGSTQELLRWESAPFIRTDTAGNEHPSTNPEDPINPNFKAIDTNELVFVDLSSLLSTTHFAFKLEFALGDSGDDWWWAMDNMFMISMTTVPGDMDINGILDEQDIDDFAQAMHSTKDYIASHFGEFPATRGSEDSVFDFDDIDWFVQLLNDNAIAASRDTVLTAIAAQAIPEPTTGVLAMLTLGALLARRRNPC